MSWSKPGDDPRDLGRIPCVQGCGGQAAIRRSAKTRKYHEWCRSCGTTLNGNARAQNRILSTGHFFAAGEHPKPKPAAAAAPTSSSPAQPAAPDKPRGFLEAFAHDD